MTQRSTGGIPTHPKIRMLEPQLVDYQGQRMIYLHDELGIAAEGALIPQQLAPLLSLFDGTRDIASLRSGLLMRTGVTLPESAISNIIAQLDKALMLENGAFQQAAERFMRSYRRAKHRQASHADAVYPSNRLKLAETIDAYCANMPLPTGDAVPSGSLVGMVCPHIDYARGNKTYAELWQRAKPSLDEVELVVIFGTDHSGGLGALTPTRQSYATPYGILPTDTEIVDGVAEAIGAEKAFREEIHHIREHSIELASVWLHHFLDGQSLSIVPILCGSFHHFTSGRGNPSEDDDIKSVLQYLREATDGRKTLVIAAGDLAHMGPAFGDARPLDAVARAKLTADDRASIADICNGDAEAFMERSRNESDSRRICGISPIYLALQYLNGRVQHGESIGYDQCPADQQGGSVVSIVGALLYSDS